MTAFIILAAGRGTRMGRVGDHLHKALAPLNGKAIITHQILNRPKDTRVIIATGHRATQVREYVEMAHPEDDITFVDVPHYDAPGNGPGASLLETRNMLDDNEDFFFTSCDTLWEYRPQRMVTSWMGVAPVPGGTPPARWCRVVTDDMNHIQKILDKSPKICDAQAYVGLAYVSRVDAEVFWSSLSYEGDASIAMTGEHQVTGGFYALLLKNRTVTAERVVWTDIGDEDAYRHAVEQHAGFDWVKAGQATYVIPETGRVVKHHHDSGVLAARVIRGKRLAKIAPSPMVQSKSGFVIGYPYVPGLTVYDWLDANPDAGIDHIIDWVHENIFLPSTYKPNLTQDECTRAMMFYRDKTFQRVMELSPELRSRALDVVTRVDWSDLAFGMLPGSWHGDLNFGNMIISNDGKITAIDWREDFAGNLDYGDIRYDLAKLLAGMVVHWGNARKGDFRPWTGGTAFANQMRLYIAKNALAQANNIEIIAALSLINSAPLHAAPLDAVLVARGVAWLEEVL
jgi:NDP-sugar pyrophosphorylase family protein